MLTSDGVRPIRELAGGVHRVLNARADWVEAPFRSYGVQRLHRITLTRDRRTKELFATDGHRWFVRSGASGQSLREVLTTDLERADRLASVRVGARATPALVGGALLRTSSPTIPGGSCSRSR